MPFTQAHADILNKARLTQEASIQWANLVYEFNLSPEVLERCIQLIGADPDTNRERRIKSLVEMAQKNPWRLFTIEEITHIIGHSADIISKAKALGAKFIRDKTRPEWVFKWMKKHKNFSSRCTTCEGCDGCGVASATASIYVNE